MSDIEFQEDPDGDPPEAIVGSKEVGALAHLYRAEVYRSTIWRQRLDQTTNWAVISTGIGLSVSFASDRASPFPIVLVGALCIMFLILEARRYRFFYVWRFRARVLEIAFYVPMLRGEGARIPLDRGTAQSDDYEKPQYRISMPRAIGRHIGPIPGLVSIVFGLAFHAAWMTLAWKTWFDERQDKTKMADFLKSREDVNRRPKAEPLGDITQD